ncbi:class I SAM-dependent methyltransferase [Modestobacter sp. VKM Ac-2986]|uniref:class I SAM-dependent methyltransferase n=1 Tax=Modestobacter sp. VKM Ac-2986 TaxID=3004140 RepID=UPI0022AB1B20|nr:class I SAM-dependent methyltransferase [Modestobacter sp. VKM Ac-2986]MCZ2828257.1 class I SAM-dependent methyltransferase [Modestobacter sp. VKM Ac-2986]
MPDRAFADPRLAELYDPLDPDRSDLDVYAGIVEELGARTVLDVGCGTGTFACLLAGRGLTVTALDPAAASIDVARRKPDAGLVDWVVGDASSLPPLAVDLVTMTANVAQVFCTDADWTATLRAVHDALRPGGRLVFESRDPARRAWEEWAPARTHTTVDVPGVGPVESWVEVLEVRGDLVGFRETFVLGGEVLTSESTLRFRTRAELVGSVTAAGLVVDEVRDAPDRPGRELVVLARRPG